ncbi:uncharacterized protein LOC126614748 [Malus sylvestris]|uniref:uncharacterized protein LOC126614748 n=1 Tax=Malus sylvestris TaxID=3752 RepID=UPI0021AD012C|nr:uncharacterized protein LOC126614748 [Malus sylvestris]
MSKFNEKSQILMFSLLVILLVLAPLLSSSLRTPYLYIITNLLIIALGAQAGLLSSFTEPNSDNDKKNGSGTGFSFAPKPVVPTELASSDKRVVARNDENQTVVAPQYAEKKARVVEKSKSEKIVDTVKVESVEKCTSMPSLFFIGGGETDHGDYEVIGEKRYVEEEEEEVLGELSGQELFAKAENFIGNFYKQLKMQREESWKNIHEFYHMPSNNSAAIL